MLIGTAIMQINTAINYSSRLIGFVQGIFISTVVTVIYPFFSKLCAKEDYDALNEYISGSIFTIFIEPITIIAVMYISDIVSIVFERGEFVKRDVELTVFSLVFSSLGFLFFAIREVFNRTFYALQDTKTPMINGAIDVLVNIVADLLLVKSLRQKVYIYL